MTSRLETRKYFSPTLVAWALLVFAIPFYVVESGLPQPGNLLIVVVAPLSLLGWNGRLSRRFTSAVKWLWWFTVWVFVVDVGWTLVLGTWSVDGKSSTLIFPTYYVYNFLIVLVALVLYQRYRDAFIKVTANVLGISVILLLIASIFLGSGVRERAVLFFNNPNQLGAYALAAACVIKICQRRSGFGTARTSIVLVACLYLAFLSASRAAVGSILILLSTLVFSSPRTIVLVSLLALGLVSLAGPVARAIDETELRIEVRREGHEDLISGRAYDRLWKFPEYLVLGAGEGNTMRFVEDEKHVMEIHSSFGTIAFSYGIVGSLLFAAFMWNVLRGSSPQDMLAVAAIFAYGVTHQGLRSTMLWVFLSMFLAMQDSSAVGVKAPDTLDKRIRDIWRARHPKRIADSEATRS
jgi:hypothetical protein